MPASHRLLGPALLALGGAAVLAVFLAPPESLLGHGFGRRRVVTLALGLALIAAALPRARARLGALWVAAGRASARTCLGLAVWFGLLTGFVEVLHQSTRKHLFGVMLKHTEMLLWMAPAVHLVLALALGSALALLARLRPALVSRPAAVFVFAAAAAWSQLLLHGWLTPVAALALAAGIGAQLARSATAHWDGFAVLRRRTTPALLGLFALALIGVPLAGHLAEHGRLADLPPAPAGAPNVLLIVLDTVRADHLGSHGYARDTMPHLDALGRRGTAFDRAVSTSSWTLPAHATIFTGCYDHEDSADWVTPMDGTHPTLAEILGQHGYQSGGFVGNLGYCSHVHGLARGFTHYDDYQVNPVVTAWHVGISRKLYPGTVHADGVRNDARVVTDAFLDWLPARGERPFFAFLNYFDAHSLYLPPPPWDEKWGPRSPHLRSWYLRKNWSDAELRGFVDAYDGLLGYIDSQVARIVDELAARQMLDDTLIVITADHGEQFGENGLTEHGNSLYWPSLHVPLAFVLPGRIPAGQRIATPVSLRDLPATILALLGVEAEPFPGSSLAGLWQEGAPMPTLSPILSEISKGINTAPELPVSRGDMKSLLVGEGARELHFIRDGDGRGKLYDVRADPREEIDLRATPEGEAAATRLRAQLDELAGGR